MPHLGRRTPAAAAPGGAALFARLTALAAGALMVPGACASADDPGGDPDGGSGGLFTPDAPGSGSEDAGPDAAFCPTDPCDLHDQCGCGEGEACDIDLDDNELNTCREVTASGSHADSCEEDGRTGCRPGFVCIASEPSFCRSYCEANADCPGEGGHCIRSVGGRGDNQCTFHCNAAEEGGGGRCPDGREACQFYRQDENADWYTDCYEPGTGGHAATCENDLDCRAAHRCLIFGEDRECREICVIGEGGCAEGRNCCPHPSEPRIGTREYGICLERDECP